MSDSETPRKSNADPDDELSENEDAKENKSITSIVRAQCLARCFIARSRVLKKLRARFEKIYDFKRNRFYYYDTVTDMSSWRKHRLFRKHDIETISPMFTSETGAEMIQKHMRRYLALMRVRMLYQSRVSAVPDARTGGIYYYNSYTGEAMWELPKFMKGKLTHKRRADRRPGDSDSDSDEDDSGNDSDSEAEKLRRKMNRKHPRSKIQILVDTAEDDWANKEIHLDLSGLGSKHITSRIYDLSFLHTLILENNCITRLSDQLSYLSKLQVLNIRNNQLTDVPKEIGDCKFLRIVLLGKNLLKTLPANFFLLGRLNELELSGNPLEELPIITGDMHLLKVLKDWEVGVSAFKQLKWFAAADIHLKQWPPQIDRISKLEYLDLSHNSLLRAPESIARNNNLTFLDLSYNAISALPVEIYGLPLQVLKVNNNKLTEFPDPSDVRTGTFLRGEHLAELDITDNCIDQISAWVQLYSSISRFYASENSITWLSSLIGGNVFVRELDLNRCMLYKIPTELGHCTLLMKLYLDYNQLKEIPAELSSLASLEELRVSHNVLTSIPDGLFDKMMALKVLTLENNFLTELPPSIYMLPELMFLDVSRNKLESISDEVSQLVSLETFLLGENSLIQLPSNLSACGELRILEVHCNRLTSLPVTLGKLTRLRRFTIDGNRLGPNIPPVLLQLTSLPFYNISRNNIMTKVLPGDPLLSFSPSCRDMRSIGVYLSSVWSDFQGDSVVDVPIDTVGNACSVCHNISCAYFPPKTSVSSDDGVEMLREYLPIMKDIVANMAPSLKHTTLFDFAYLGNDIKQLAMNPIHSICLNVFEFPLNHGISDFKKGLVGFERFSAAARALYGLCMSYYDEYEKWKLKLKEPDDTPVKTVKKKTVSPKGKPKQVSFRKKLESKSVPSSFSQDEEQDEDLSATGRSNGDADHFTIDITKTMDSEDLDQNAVPPHNISVVPGEQPPEASPESIALSMRCIPDPPRSAQIPLISEVVLRSMLEQRHRPHHEDDEHTCRTVFSQGEDPIVYLLTLVDCYSGIGTSLVRMANFLGSLLRTIEDRGSINPSCLSVCQRIDDDFVDLLGEKAAGFARKKFKAPGSEAKGVKSEDILAQLNDMPSPGQKNGSTDDASITEAYVASEAKDQDESVNVNLYQSFDNESAVYAAVDVERNRRQILILASIFLDRALFILKCCGWDAKSMKMQNSAVSSRRAVHHFDAKAQISSVIHVGYYYGMALQKLRICSTAVREFYSVLSIGPLLVWHPLQLEIVKCYLDMGEYLKAEELLYKIIDDSPSLRLRSDKSKELGPINTTDSNLSREVRMIAAMLSSALESIRSAGVGEKSQLAKFELEATGVLHRRPVVAVEVLVGKSDLLLKKIADAKAKEKAINAVETLEFTRAQVVESVEAAKQRACSVMKAHEVFLEEMGPIVMPE